MNELEELLHGSAETAEEFLIREEQVNRQSRVDLDQDRVFRVADEGLYAQILFDFLEKELDLPVVFIIAVRLTDIPAFLCLAVYGILCCG